MMRFYIRSEEIFPEETLQELTTKGLINIHAPIAAYVKVTYEPKQHEEEPESVNQENWKLTCFRYYGLPGTAENYYYDKTFPLKWVMKRYARSQDIRCVCGQRFMVNNEEISPEESIESLISNGLVQPEAEAVKITVHIRYTDW